ncbi:MAG: hypothetical protein GY846_11175 [Deltaproteobacteria bacterium]|nr:hypothetical protein [Deltaproteobacteria bacterium]
MDRVPFGHGCPVSVRFNALRERRETVLRESDLNERAKAHFGMDLNGFVKRKIEEDGVWDYEVADMLQVKHHHIGLLRRRLGLDRTKGFAGRFDRKYGPGAVRRFKEIIENPGKNLTDAGDSFGFSREYARQVYQKLYGCSYGENHGKLKILKKKRWMETKPPKRLSGVRDKMVSMGFQPKIENSKKTARILVNGYRLGLKCSRRCRAIGKNHYFCINQKGEFNKQDCDFFICLLKRDCHETHFIIPQTAMPKCSLSLSPESDQQRSKYSKFKEAWHLLQKRNTAPGRHS